jgi:hypothetical protein
MQTVKLIMMMNATVGGVIVWRAPEANAVQKVALLISYQRHELETTYQTSANKHTEPTLPSLNLTAIHSTFLVHIARNICPTTRGRYTLSPI